MKSCALIGFPSGPQKVVAAALFFLPAMLVTYDNANDAIEAAKQRKKYLYDLAEDKGCDI